MTAGPDHPKAAPVTGIDACILLAVLLPNPGTVAAAEVEACRAVVAALETGRLSCVTSALMLAELLYALGRDGVSLERRRQLELHLTQGLRDHLTIVPADTTLACAAAEHRLAHYHRVRAPISYADSIYVVTAWGAGVHRLITVDGALLSLNDPRIVPPSALGLPSAPAPANGGDE